MVRRVKRYKTRLSIASGIRRKVVIVLLLCTIFLVPGCLDNHELEDMAFIGIVGIDPAPGRNLRITYEIINAATEAGKAGQSRGRSKGMYETFVTPSFGAARTIANANSDRILTNVQTKAVIVNEELVKREDLAEMIEALVREREYRRDLLLVTSIEPAEKLIPMIDSKFTTPPDQVIENMRFQYRYTGMVPNTSLNDFLTTIELGDQLAITPIIGPRKELHEQSVIPRADEVVAGQTPIKGGDNKIEFTGAEVYNSGHAVGRLMGAEVRIYLLLTNQIRWFLENIQDPIVPAASDAVSVEQSFPPRISCHLDRGRLHFIIRVPLRCALIGSNAKIDYVQTARYTRVLERALDKEFENEAQELIKRCQTEFHGDIFGLGLSSLKWWFLTEQDWKAFQYTKKFCNAKIDVHFMFRMTAFGKQRSPYGT